MYFRLILCEAERLLVACGVQASHHPYGFLDSSSHAPHLENAKAKDSSFEFHRHIFGTHPWLWLRPRRRLGNLEALLLGTTRGNTPHDRRRLVLITDDVQANCDEERGKPRSHHANATVKDTLRNPRLDLWGAS